MKQVPAARHQPAVWAIISWFTCVFCSVSYASVGRCAIGRVIALGGLGYRRRLNTWNNMLGKIRKLFNNNQRLLINSRMVVHQLAWILH